VVLTRTLPLLLAAACSQSLFENPGGGGGGDALTCQDPCIADAAGDFDGSPNGTSGRWRYLEDTRNRAWAAMTLNADNEMVGGDAANKITTCADNPDAAACAALPDALLVSTSGATAAADPALEFTAQANGVIQLDVHAFVDADNPDQVIRIYRNAREDAVFTGVAAADSQLDETLTYDALAGDRFLVAVAPSGLGASDVALHVFVSETGQVFPSACQLALEFNTAAGAGVDNQCGMAFTDNDFTTGMIAPSLGGPAFPELGMGGEIAPNQFWAGGDQLDKSGDFTVQLWVRVDAYDGINSAWAFTDYDLDSGGGVGVVFYNDAAASQDVMEVSTCTNPNPLMFLGDRTPFPFDGSWHHVRVVHAADTVTTCLDGARVMSFPLPAGKLNSNFKPQLGKNQQWTPQGAFFDGAIDDVRVFSYALPCE